MVKDRLRQHHLNDLRFVRSLSAGELFLVMSRLGLKPRSLDLQIKVLAALDFAKGSHQHSRIRGNLSGLSGEG